MCNKCMENGGKGGAGQCEGWPIDNTRVVTYGPRISRIEMHEEPSMGGGAGRRYDHCSLGGSVAVYGRLEPPIDRIVHVPDQKPKVTIHNNTPNSTVTVQEVDGEIIVTITEAPKHEEPNKR